jgi:CBS-domain-containing membrane protein
MADFRALPFHPLPGLVTYFEPSQELPAQVNEKSPAVLVMTDLRQQIAVTVEPNVSIDWALQRMKTAGVRLLIVVNSDKEILGLITSNDILGEKPLQFHQELHLRYEEIMVRDIMTAQSELEVLHMGDVLRASVGDIVATLQSVGRRHALVLDDDIRTGQGSIRGIFSASQISKQLDLSIDMMAIAQTFAEVEVVLNNQRS